MAAGAACHPQKFWTLSGLERTAQASLSTAGTMATTLPLFWDLSATSVNTRLDASVKLVSSLEHFQSQFVPKQDAGRAEDEEGRTGDGLDALNAQDVSYSIRRLVRGLGSPRESSRLGFAVALTEVSPSTMYFASIVTYTRCIQLLARIDTVTCAQIVALILDTSKTQGSMTGQEERDMLFARLFGFISVIQSGLLFRETTLPSSSSPVSNLENYKEVLAQLVALGEKKSWIRESAWWAIGLAIDALHASDVSWKDEAFEATSGVVFAEKKTWSPEKISLTLKLQAYLPSRDWQKLLSPTFKSPELLSTGNLGTIARILRASLTLRVYQAGMLTMRPRNRVPMTTRSLMFPSQAHGSRKFTSSGKCSLIECSRPRHTRARPLPHSRTSSG